MGVPHSISDNDWREMRVTHSISDNNWREMRVTHSISDNDWREMRVTHSISDNDWREMRVKHSISDNNSKAPWPSTGEVITGNEYITNNHRWIFLFAFTRFRGLCSFIRTFNWGVHPGLSSVTFQIDQLYLPSSAIGILFLSIFKMALGTFGKQEKVEL